LLMVTVCKRFGLDSTFCDWCFSSHEIVKAARKKVSKVCWQCLAEIFCETQVKGLATNVMQEVGNRCLVCMHMRGTLSWGQWTSRCHFPAPGSAARQTARGLRKPGKKTIDARSCRRKVTPSEPDAKAILLEPRNVKKQMPINLSHGKREKLMSYRINYLPTGNNRRLL